MAFGQFEDIGTAQEMSAADSLEYRLAYVQWEPSDSVAFAKAEAKFDKTKLKQRKQKKQKKSKPGAYAQRLLEWGDWYIWSGKRFIGNTVVDVLKRSLLQHTGRRSGKINLTAVPYRACINGLRAVRRR